jgi:hypothetical protein
MAFHQRDRFEVGLRELGWTPATNIVIEYRYAAGSLDRLPAFADELVRVPVDVIVARGLTIAPARRATVKIPIVMAADPEPVRSGFVASLARPGSNITGFSTQALDSEPKQLEFRPQRRRPASPGTQADRPLDLVTERHPAVNAAAVQASGHNLLTARGSGGTDAGRRRDARG